MKPQNSIFEKYEALLNAIKEMTEADDCSIFLLDSELGMDEEEKKEVFQEGIIDINKINLEDANMEAFLEFLKNCSSEDINKYSILTYFVGTELNWRLEGYKKRPKKYVVFNWIDKHKSNLEIINEGLPAYVVRTGESLLINKRSELDAHNAFAGYDEGSENIHDHCYQVALIPLINGKNKENKIIGVIRCDIYNLGSQVKFTQDTIVLLESLNDLICRIINLGKESEYSYSYAKLFNGIRLIDSIKQIKTSDLADDSDKELYKITKKLFYVLKRRRYFAYEAIIERVMSYFKDVCDALDLDYMPIIKLLESFKKHEDLILYSNEKYRDHFMHQFHVFVVGYIIMHYIGIENIIGYYKDNFSLHDIKKLQIKNVLRMWFLTSIFHDSCYIFPEFENNISNFITEILENHDNAALGNNEKGKFKFDVNLKWEQLASSESNIMDNICEITNYLALKNRDVNLSKLNTIFCKLMFSRNHGVLSALIMLQKMSGANKWTENMLYRFEKYIAASSIALHTSDSYLLAKELFGKDKLDKKIFFEHCPLTFLLAYCDYIQEWGRKCKEGQIRKLAKPAFYSLEIQEDDQGKHLNCKLIYNHNNFKPGQEAPKEEDILKYANDIQNAFCSKNFGFSVAYYHTNSNDPKEEELNTKNKICYVYLENRSRRKGLRRKFNNIILMLPKLGKTYFTDYSYDSVLSNMDIGLGSNAELEKGDKVGIELVYDNVELTGIYEVASVREAEKGLEYNKFFGMVKCGN